MLCTTTKLRQFAAARELHTYLERKPSGLLRITKCWMPEKTLPPLTNE